MATKTGWHEVRQGESVESIAAGCGHLPKTIWDAPENSELRERRKDPHVLMPGDRVFVPAVKPRTFTVATGGKYRFVVERPTSRLRLQLTKGGKPRANEPFVLLVDGQKECGTTDGDGWVDHPVAARATFASLTVGKGDEEARYRIELRALDPATEASGVKARLGQLGYDVGPIDGEWTASARSALCAFQSAQGLEVTGEADEATCNKLKQVYGS